MLPVMAIYHAGEWCGKAIDWLNYESLFSILGRKMEQWARHKKEDV